MVRISLCQIHCHSTHGRIARMYLAVMISTQLLTGCRAFVQPLLSAPFLRAASSFTSSMSPFVTASNLCNNKRDGHSPLFSTIQEVGSPNDMACPATENGTRIIADDKDFLKPALDTRKYRSIVLANNLQALIVSDPETDVEAAAVHIKAGHFDDPDSRAGLAHFNEHMLFLGTEKYPKENDFETFVGKNGGITNAYTDMEDTNYYFSVAPLDHDEVESINDEDEDDQEEDAEEEEWVEIDDDKVSQALSGGLDRFAQFFIAPLFNEEAVERELRAIDSEHLNSFTSESWRNYQLLKSTCNPNHPFSKFGCGNYNTLTNGGNITGSDAISSGGSSPVPALKEFWHQKYVAENMKLCVLGRASLDEIQKEVEKAFAGVRSSGSSASQKIIDPSVIFQKEHSNYGVAFGPEHLGLIREYVPLVEERTIKLIFATPPTDDPAMVEYRPDRVVTHLLGHESPGSLHALLLEDGLVNDLSSGVGLTTSDFSLCSLTLHLTPKGMAQRDHVLSLVWQYISLVKSTAENNDKVMEAYHEELRQVSKTHFHFRENGDPTDFCSGAADLLHEYAPEKVLIGSAMPGPYNATVTKAFLERLRPDNCIVNIQNSDFEVGDDGEHECSASSSSWKIERWYKAKYREVKIEPSLQKKWSSFTEVDSRLHLPAMNSFLPTDFSLRSEDPEAKESFNEDIDYRKDTPKLLLERPGLQLWHKMDRTFRVPKTHLRLFLTSPDVYRSPRTMSLMRIYVKVLEDDLNSYIYDATIAGCSARVTCLPSGISVSVKGYSEKLPHLLDVVTGRMLTIIEEMKNADPSSGLYLKFEKATKNLLRETKNFRLESPHETASYISRVILEHNVWHVSNYIAELEGDVADKHPLTLAECAKVAEEALTQRIMATFLCMGNINEAGAHDVVKLIEQNFLHQARPLSFEEIPKLRSMKMPTKEEAVRIFGPSVQNMTIPLKIEEMTYSPSEENHAVEVILQCGAEYEMGYEGIAILELIGQIAYNSAYNILRTQEQLGYIVSAYTRKTAGSALGLSVLVQSSTKKPQELEDRIENWLVLFREELASMSADDIAKEAAAVVASLLERNMRLSDEVGTAWGSIVSTASLGTSYSTPPFDRHAKLAQYLTIEDTVSKDSEELEDSSKAAGMTKEELKARILELWDRYFSVDAPERRAISARVYGHKAQSEYEANIGKPGYLSSYDDVRQIKQFFAQWPTAPYWIQKNSSK